MYHINVIIVNLDLPLLKGLYITVGSATIIKDVVFLASSVCVENAPL